MGLSNDELERLRKRKEKLQSGSSNDRKKDDDRSSSSEKTLSASELDRIRKYSESKQSGSQRYSSQVVDDSYLDSFFRDSQDFLDDAKTSYNRLDYNSAVAESSKSYFDDLAKRENDLRNRATTIRDYMNTNRSRFDDESYKELSSYLDIYSADSISKAFYDARDYYSQWETEDDWKAAYAAAQEYDKKSKLDVEEAQKEIDEMESVYNKVKSISSNIGMGGQESDDYQQNQINEILQQYGVETEKELEALLKEKQSYLNEAVQVQTEVKDKKAYEQKLAFYNGLAQNADFGGKSTYQSTYRGGEKFNAWTGMYSDTGYDDITYDYINKDETARGRMLVNDIASNASFLGLDTSYLKEMTNDEIAIYNYLYDPNDKTASDEYLAFLLSDLTYRQRNRAQGEWASYAEEHPVLSSGFSIMTSPLKILSAVGQTADYAEDGSIDQNAAYNKFSYIPSTIREQVSSDIANPQNGVWGEVGSWTYQLGMSMGDFLVNSAISGGSSAVSLALMGSGAFADTVVSAKDRGLSDDQAMILGAVAGAAEIVTEKFSLDALFKGDLSKGAMRYILTNAFTEGTEEVSSTLINTVADVLVSKDKSEWEMAIKDYLYRNPGASQKEAFRKVLGDNLMSLGLDFLGGALMGGAMGTAGAGINYVTNARPGIKENIEAKNLYGDSTAELIKEGLASDPKSDSYDLAKYYQKKIEKGKSLSGYEIRQQVEANEAQFVVENYEEALPLAKQRLTELGETKDVDKIAKLVAKRASGQELTSAEKSTLVRSQYGPKVAKEMTPSKGTELTYKSLEKRIGTEGRFNVSESGKAVIRDTEEAIDLAKVEVVKAGEGQMTFKLEDGKEVYAGDIDFADENQSFLVSAVSDIENITPAAANAIMRDVVDTSKPLGEQLNGIDEAYTYGYHGYSVEDMKAGDFTTNLSNQQMMSAYKLGQSARATIDKNADAPKVRMRTAAQAKLTEKQKTTQQKARFDADAEVYFQDGATITKFDEHNGQYDNKRMAGVNAAKFLSKLGIGKKYYFYESYVNAEGVRVYKDSNGVEKKAPNGMYKSSDGSIHIDLNAGDNGQGTTLFTLGHELTHFVKDQSKKQFKALADLVTEAYSKTDMSMHERVLEKQNQLSEIRGENVSYDEAFEEVVADAMSTMFTDGNIYEKLTELKAKDRGLFDTIKNFFDKLIAKFKEIYANLTPDQKDAQDIREMKDMFNRIQDAFAKALVEASELAQAGIEVNDETDSGSLQSVRYVLNEADRKKAAKALADRFKVTEQEAVEWLKAETSLASLILNPKYSQFLDYEADPNEVAIKQNSDYPQGTVDFSNICKKRREFTQVMNRILRNFPNHVFAATDLAKIRTIMGEEGMTLPCGICYVEDRRQLDTIVAQDFINGLKLYRDGSKTRPDGKPFNANQLKGLQLTDGDTYVPTIYELVTLEGRNSLKEKNPNMEAAWVKYNNARGMQAVRLLTNEAEYKRQILKYNKNTVQSKNDHGGLRIYSFSDMEMFHLIDIIQVLTDCATVGLKVQGYTKVNEYAKAVKDTGEKLNRSLIPKGDLGYHIENGKVVLDYDTVEGIDIHSEDFFDSKDNPDVGNITIGINSVQIRAAMASDFVDYIIPFHTGQSEEVLGEKGIAAWENYKDYQTEKDLTTGKTSSHQVNIYTEVFQAAEKEGNPIQNKRQFVEKFLQVCKENGLQPRFSQFLNVDSEGNYVYTEGYHKFLVDFKTFAQTEVGEYLPQRPVKPIFDDAYITSLLEAYVEEQQIKDAEVAKQMPKVIERITNEIVKNSDRNTDLENSNRIAYSNRRNQKARFKENVFPPFNESHSDAHELAERWSRNENTEPGDRKLISYHRRWYLIEAFDGMKYGYQIIKPVPVEDYEKEAKACGTFTNYASLQEASHQNAQVYSNVRTSGGGRYRTDSFVSEHGREGTSVYGVDSAQNRGRESNHDSSGNNESGSDDRKRGREPSVTTLRLDELSARIKWLSNQLKNDRVSKEKKTEYRRELRKLRNEMAELIFPSRSATKNSDRYSERGNAPTFYSQMAKVVDSMKQDKFGASSVVSMLRGRGVKAEEIKWSGIEEWLEGKKSVTKAELQEFIAGSMLQIEEEVLDNKDRPYTEDQQKRLDEYEAKRDEVAKRLASEWKKITGEEITIRNAAGLESFVTQAILEANSKQKKATFEGRLLAKLKSDLKEVIENNDDFGFDSWMDAMRSIHRHRRDFITHYEMSTNEKAIIVKYCNALNAYNELPNIISDADTDRLRAIAREAAPWNRKIMEVKHEYNEEAAKHRPNWWEYSLKGGKNYREMLFRIPGSTYSNEAMFAHWKERSGVLAHARVQDMDTFIGKMLFIEEIQSDWHNQGHKEGYRKEGEKTDLMLSRESQKAYEEFYTVVEKMLESNANWEDDNAIYYAHPVVVAEMFDGNESYFDEYGFTDEQRETIRSMVAEEAARQEALKTAPKDDTAPDAPFKENYHEYVLKRLLRMAAEEDYDSIGWTTAETQDDRWQNNLPHKEGTGKSGFLEGYRIEYDQKIKNFLTKFGKKWGTTVGKTVLDNGTEVWSMAITDSMKDSVLTEGQPLYQDRTGDSVSNRSLLANAFEGIVQNSVEYKMLQDYKSHIKELNELEAKLSDLNAKIRKIRFGTEGARDTMKLTELENEAKEVAKEINRYDKRLLNLEASEPLRKVIDRERKKEAQRTKDHVKEIQQNKKVRAEQTELRHKIRKAVRDLDKILNRGNKKLNVKEDMKGFASKALELADYLFTDHISNDELIRKGITVRMTPKEAALVKETEGILSKLYDHADSLTDEEFTRLDAKRKANEDKLRDLLTAQRNERLNTPVYKLFSDLVTEYARLKNSNQEAVKGAYDPKVEEFLRSYIGEANGETDSDRVTLLQNMRVADMTTDELWKLHNAYQMVLHSVRTANKLFASGNTETIEQMVTQIVTDFGSRKIPEKKLAIAAQKLSNMIGWDYEKLYYALDRIGSDAFTKLIMNLADSENTVMQDIIEAVAFRDEIVEKYGFNNWDVNKKIDREFLDNTGKKFNLTLGQLMSLYAYSRREGAWDHIEYGGFVFSEAALTNPKPADSYKLSKEQCEAITNLLTNDQKHYVEDMQKFLSETMGAKGNEVSMLLYGIKMFNEKNYFPIRISGDFKAQANESQAKEFEGFQSMSNAGFTHAQNPNAKAPFMLASFNEVWSDHVNEMSRYHGTVPALEDIRRVMNRSSYSESTAESTAVKVVMKNHFGEEAVKYFDNLYREANSGAINDRLQKTSKKMLSLFRKNSVAYSLSVLVQQPASIVRAYAMIDRKYFGVNGVGVITSGVAKAVTSKWNKAYANAYNEMLKYAPGVTMTKEIGGFDTATGGSIRTHLLDTKKSFKQKWKTGTALEKGKAVLSKVDDNAIANLPNVADKIAWIEIWNACKRETVAKHKNLTPGSDEFMKIVGDRFTEVIRATQVYDSIFAKSPMLKSKNLAVQYLVNFANEPNTVANMVEKAARDVARGNWKQGARTAGVIVYSIVFTNLLKSLVYAMRDDDEDETYIEKYIEAVVGNLLSDFHPLSYLPIGRDVLSLVQGYDVERPDMAIIADAIEAYRKKTELNDVDTEDMTEEKLIEHEKKVTEANWKLVESVASFFGIPVKNIRREVMGIINTMTADPKKSTKLSIKDTVLEAVIDTIPFMSGGKNKQDKLYEAIMSGDKAYEARLKSTYKDEDAYHSAVRTVLRENDPRIHQAALARYNGNIAECKRIYQEIKKEDKFDPNDILEAIYSEESKIKGELEPKKESSNYSSTDFVNAILLGDANMAKSMRDDIIRFKVADGKTQEEAEESFADSVATATRNAFDTDLLDEAGTKKMLVEYAGKDEEEAAAKVSYWAFCKAHPQYDLSEANVKDYHEFAEPSKIPLDVFVQYLNSTKGLETIRDKWGDEVKSKREQVLEVIDSLPLTWQQKDSLYLAAGYAESKIWDVPW